MLPAESIQTCVTSPPYYKLRDYGVAGQMGLEATSDAYVTQLVTVFREVKRVLRDDGTLWLNLGDSYAGGGGFSAGAPSSATSKSGRYGASGALKSGGVKPCGSVKPKDLIMIPARVAIALQADGWYLRSDIIWHKLAAMPESVRDRPTNCYEHVFLLTKSQRYYYDGDAIREPDGGKPGNPFAGRQGGSSKNYPMSGGGGSINPWQPGKGRNCRNLWTINNKPFKGAHFATMPPALANRCILAGSKPGDMVLDPFAGAGTTGLAATNLGRDSILIELNVDYIKLIQQRLLLPEFP